MVGSSCHVQTFDHPNHFRSCPICFTNTSPRITPILACQHYFNLAMSSSSIAIGALILVPIVIATSAAFIALKCAEVLQTHWPLYVADSGTVIILGLVTTGLEDEDRTYLKPHYADSWADLESINTERGYDTFIGQSPRRNSVKSVSEGKKDQSPATTFQEKYGILHAPLV
jgi:hypothetical protein